MRKIITLIAIVVFFTSTFPLFAEGLTYEVIADLKYQPFGSAHISDAGDVITEEEYEGKGDGSLLRYKAKGQAVKTIAVNKRENFSPIGFYPNGEIAAVSEDENYDISFVILNPHTLERRVLSLPEADSYDDYFINSSGLVASIRDEDDNAIVTFISPNLEKKSYTIQGSYESPTYGMAGFSSSGKLFLMVKDFDNKTKRYYSVTQEGVIEDLGDSLLGEAKFESYANTRSDFLILAEDKDDGVVNYGIYNMLDGTLKAGSADLKTSNGPSFENRFYFTGITADNAGSFYMHGSSIGYSETYYVGSTILKVNPDGRIEHMNCFVDPALGHISSILEVNKNGEILATVLREDNKFKAVVFQPFNTSTLTNYCLKVEAEVNKACKGNLKSKGKSINETGYTDAVNSEDPGKKCKLKLKFTDIQNNPAAGSEVVIRKSGLRKVSSRRTNSKGEVTLNLDKVLINRKACGWSIFLEDFEKFQPNGIVIFREQTSACRRI